MNKIIETNKISEDQKHEEVCLCMIVQGLLASGHYTHLSADDSPQLAEEPGSGGDFAVEVAAQCIWDDIKETVSREYATSPDRSDDILEDE